MSINIDYQNLHLMYKMETGNDRPIGREMPKRYFAPGILEYMGWLEEKVTEQIEQSKKFESGND